METWKAFSPLSVWECALWTTLMKWWGNSLSIWECALRIKYIWKSGNPFPHWVSGDVHFGLLWWSDGKFIEYLGMCTSDYFDEVIGKSNITGGKRLSKYWNNPNSKHVIKLCQNICLQSVTLQSMYSNFLFLFLLD